jgi:hypothetical protein
MPIIVIKFTWWQNSDMDREVDMNEHMGDLSKFRSNFSIISSRFVRQTDHFSMNI